MIRDTKALRESPVAWVAVGIAAFMAPQVALFLTTPQSPLGIKDPGWFLNSGDNVATIRSVIAAVAALLAVRRRWRVEDTAKFALGVLMAMVGTLVMIGPGNLFPIVIVVGAVVLGLAILLGTAVGYALQRLANMRMEPSRR
jgi:hypothetical protein